MKPIQLIMSAFGSYAGKETIPFSDVQQGIFLITGDTGSGKTTVFDAVTYALYDQTSGGKRDGNMMRSQYAQQNTDTYVEFTFSYRGEIYTIRRNPEYYRPRKRKNADGPPKYVRELAKVELILPDGSVFIGKKRETDKKIEEIIGLDAGQFTQIAMIAQGDFLKLLHAESKERKIIFSKIFNTKIYWRIQETLKARAKDLYIQLEDNLKDSRREIARVECLPDSLHQKPWKEIQALKSPPLDHVLDLLAEIITEGTEQEKIIRDNGKENQSKIDKLNGKIKQAETIHALFKALDTAQAQELQLQEQATHFKHMRDRIALIKRCHSVLVFEEQYLEKRKVLQESAVKLQSLKDWLASNQEILHSLYTEYQTQEAHLKKQEPKLQIVITRIADALPQYDLLAQYSEQLQSACEHKNSLEEKAAKSAETILAQSQELELLHKALDSLRDCHLEQERAHSKVHSLRERKKALKELQTKIDHLKILRQKQHTSYNQLQDASVLCKNAYSNYETCYEAFFAEQAGILAKDLTDGLPCPVCGSVTHPHTKELTQGAPTQSTVMQLKKVYEQADKEREKIAGEFQRYTQSVDYETESVTTLGIQLIGTDFQAQDLYFSMVPGLILLSEQELEQQTTLWNQFSNQVSELDKTNRLITQKEELTAKLLDQKETLDHALQNAAIAQKELEASYTLLLKSLPSPSKQEADKALLNAESELLNLKNAVQQARLEYQKVSDEITQKKGEALNEEQAGHSYEAAVKLAESQFKKALADNQFSGDSVYQETKLMLHTLPDLEATYRQYEDACIKVSESVRTLKEQTAKKKLLPLDTLKEELSELTAINRKLQQEYMNLHSMNQKNQDASKLLAASYEAQGALQSEYIMINNLNQTANGSLTGTVKLDFETYVQRQYFKQIIQAANRRLVQMTSNQFLLACRDLKDLGTQGQVGLDLDIYNLVTDSTRDVKTLSGGESFLAALSMALGLADIIQNTAGAIRLDTMFVDEGFGSLDDDARAQAILILNELADQKRLVGIISHVNELKEQIDRKLIVTKTERGSTVHWNL